MVMKKRVVVIGGGFAGSYVAQKLQRDFSVTLIDSKNYFEYTPGILRTIVEPKHWKRIRVLHRKYLPNATIILGVVLSMNEQEVQVGEKRVPFDYLVICSGSSYNLPIKEQHAVLPVRARHLIQAHEKLVRAKNVLIIGGGLVGVELAAEIATHYSDKKISLIHPHQFLIERNQLRSQIYAAKFLKNHGVNILYRDRVIRSEHGTFVTEQGRRLHPDLAFLCTGITPNFSFLEGNFAHVLNECHQICVNEYLQVMGFSTIFSAGDITDVSVEKTAQNAEKQAKIVVANICALEHGRVLKRYGAVRTPQVINLGKWDGIFEIGKHVIIGLLPAFLKTVIERRELWRRGLFLVL